MQTFIEDNMQPETVNELALLNRIRELKAAFYRAGKYPSYGEEGPVQLTVDPMTDSVRVPLAVGADAYDDTVASRYVIQAEVRGGYNKGVGEHFGYRTFIDKGTLYRMDKYGIMRYLDNVRRDTDRKLAEFLTKETS